MAFLVVLIDDTTRQVDDADSYAQDGPLTTFFVGDGRPTRPTSAFASPVASFRTERVAEIRRIGNEPALRVLPA